MKIDRTLASQHLSYLSYKPGDNVYFRFFYHSSDIRKDGDEKLGIPKDKGRKLSELNWEQIEKYQSYQFRLHRNDIALVFGHQWKQVIPLIKEDCFSRTGQR